MFFSFTASMLWIVCQQDMLMCPVAACTRCSVIGVTTVNMCCVALSFGMMTSLEFHCNTHHSIARHDDGVVCRACHLYIALCWWRGGNGLTLKPCLLCTPLCSLFLALCQKCLGLFLTQLQDEMGWLVVVIHKHCSFHAGHLALAVPSIKECFPV